MTLEIRTHAPGKDIGPFIQVAHDVYRGDPAWVPPLEMEISDRLTPRKNPFFEHAEVALFTAWRDGRPVGRISAQIDREHLRIHDDDAGLFGFFDTADDEEAARALVDRAATWLAERGMKRMRGPFSLSINEESGVLVEGFEHPPFIMMPHSRPYQAGLAEKAGLEKVKDLWAWRYDVGTVHKRADRAWREIQAMPEVTIRSVRKSKMHEELAIIMEIFNDAWKDNWGFVPATAAEVKKSAQDMKLILDEDISFFAEIDGRPVAMCLCIPNINEATYDLRGKLFPFGFAKLLWRMKVRRPKTARLMILGIRSELRRNRRYGPLSLAMTVELSKRGTKKGYEWAELSWTLEDNKLMNAGIKAMGGRVYKKYRLFEKEIG